MQWNTSSPSSAPVDSALAELAAALEALDEAIRAEKRRLQAMRAGHDHGG